MLRERPSAPFALNPSCEHKNAAAVCGSGVDLSESAFCSSGRYFLFAFPLPPDERDPPDERELLPEERAGEEERLEDEELLLTVEREGVERRVEELFLTERFPEEERVDLLSRLDGLSTDRDDFFPELERRTALLSVDPRFERDSLTLLLVSCLRVVRSFLRWMDRPELSFLRGGFCVRRVSLDLIDDLPREVPSRPCTILL